MKTILAVVLACGLTGCGHAIHKKADIGIYCNICRNVEKLECISESLMKSVKSVDAKLAERGITDADINRALDKRDEAGDKIK